MKDNSLQAGGEDAKVEDRRNISESVRPEEFLSKNNTRWSLYSGEKVEGSDAMGEQTVDSLDDDPSATVRDGENAWICLVCLNQHVGAEALFLRCGFCGHIRDAEMENSGGDLVIWALLRYLCSSYIFLGSHPHHWWHQYIFIIQDVRENNNDDADEGGELAKLNESFNSMSVKGGVLQDGNEVSWWFVVVVEWVYL